MKKWIPTVITLILTLVGLESTSIQNFISFHPQLGVILAGIWAVIKGIVPSPIKPKGEEP